MGAFRRQRGCSSQALARRPFAAVGAALILALAVGGCASVHSAYMTNLSVPAEQGKQVAATAAKTVVLGFNFTNDYVFEAREALLDACPGGRVTGVLSTYETFFYLLWTRHEVRVEGVCVAAGAALGAPPLRPRPPLRSSRPRRPKPRRYEAPDLHCGGRCPGAPDGRRPARRLHVVRACGQPGLHPGHRG